MTHAEAQELLAALSLDATSSQERDAILAHVAECDECARELGELRDVAHSMTHLAPEMPMDPARQARVRAHLLARATERAQPAAPTPKPATISMQPRRLTQFSTAHLAAAAAIVVVGIALALWAVSAGERANALQRDTQRLLAAQRSFEREIAARDSALADRQALLDAMTGADVQVIEAGAPSTRQPSGKMFWDQVTGQWTFVAHNLPHAAPNRTYQLWLITRAQRKISAGVFATSASGDALVIAHYSLPKDSLAAIAVTDEPSGGSPQPTTTPVLVGTAQ